MRFHKPRYEHIEDENSFNNTVSQCIQIHPKAAFAAYTLLLLLGAAVGMVAMYREGTANGFELGLGIACDQLFAMLNQELPFPLDEYLDEEATCDEMIETVMSMGH